MSNQQSVVTFIETNDEETWDSTIVEFEIEQPGDSNTIITFQHLISEPPKLTHSKQRWVDYALRLKRTAINEIEDSKRENKRLKLSADISTKERKHYLETMELNKRKSENDFENFTYAIASKVEENNELKIQSEQKDRDIRELRSRLEKRDDRIEIYKAENYELKMQSEQKDRDTRKLGMRLEKRDERIDELERQLIDMKAHYEQKLREHEDDMQQAQEFAQQLQENIDMQEKTIRKLERNAKELTESVETGLALINTQTETVQALSNENEELERANEQLRDDNEKLQKEITINTKWAYMNSRNWDGA